jgi:hypothetical protein
MDSCTYVCDVGSTKANRRGEAAFGWSRVSCEGQTRSVSGGAKIDSLISCFRADAGRRQRLSLGMECPLYFPVPSKSSGLSCGRDSEGNRSCFAPAGGYVAALGLHQLAFILQELNGAGLMPTLDHTQWANDEDGRHLLLWEAFVSGKAHCGAGADYPGMRDSATAAWEFASRLRANQLTNDVALSEETSAISLAGAALLWSGWTQEISVLKQPVLVVRPEKAFEGPVDIIE